MTDPDAREASEWVTSEIQRLRGLSFEELATMESNAEHRPMVTAAANPLMLETQVFWDDREKTNLRVMVGVWDPAKRVSGSIAKDDFIRAPDGLVRRRVAVLGGHLRTLAQPKVDLLDVEQHENASDNDDIEEQPHNRDGVVGIAFVGRRVLRQRR
jgi:hypothetical protein